MMIQSFRLSTLLLLTVSLAQAAPKNYQQKYSLEKAMAAPARFSKSVKKKVQAERIAAAKIKLKNIGKTSRMPAAASDPGSLVRATLNSSTGVLLEDIPLSIRTRVRNEYLAKPNDFWVARARMQVETTLYRLVFRNFYYNNKMQLPLPPQELWQISAGQPYVTNVDGHELVMVDYHFQSTLLAPENSPGLAEPKLSSIGGTWDEPFVLPADPELLLERTGYACMDEEDFPPNSVDSENARSFYDHICKGGNNGCHVTLPVPTESCSTALKNKVGRISAVVHFERLAWNAATANQIRVGQANPSGADIEVLGAGVEVNRLIYRYIAPGSCAVQEGCVGGSGWRRLLQFDASVANRGSAPAHLGHVEEDSLLFLHNMFEFSACHGHNHFSHYGKFTYGSGSEQLGSKRAFCLESTSRYSNNESTPLTHPYTCHYQGIEAGWGDDYIAGIECQWVDVTPIAAPKTAPLGFQANPDQFICEGQPIFDAQGNFTFVPTTFTTETGAPVDRIACNFSTNWNANNFQSRNVTIPVEGSYVTETCTRGQDTNKRNCGFSKLSAPVTCSAGSTVKLSCSIPSGSAPQALRICEASSVLGTGISCTYRDAQANEVIESSRATNVTFTCPAARDSLEQGGKYSLYRAPAHIGDATAAISCSPR